MDTETMIAPMALCISAVITGVLSQWLLSSMKFSNVSAEGVFRGLYLASHLAGVLACGALARRLSDRPGLMLLLLAPALLCLGLQWQASMGSDGQDAILLLLLPVLQLLLTGAAFAAMRLLAPGSGR